MSFDELKNMAKGWIRDWNKGKLKKKLVETAQEALDNRVENLELKNKIGHLEDELRKLKKEKAKPKIKAINSKDLEKKKRKKHKKSSKVDKLEIDQEVIVEVDKEDLPKDAKFIGSREVIVQEIRLDRKNTRFILERYYSKIEGRVIEGEIPESFRGSEFGPELRSFILYQYYKNRVPHKKIQSMLADLGVSISAGSICNILNKLSSEFRDDLDSAKRAGLKNCSQVHLDETGAKYRGLNYYTFGLSNRYFTSFKTRARKNKESVEEVISSLIVPKRVKFLITDDAPNFKNLYKNHQLCWIHEIRKYKLCEVYKKIESNTLNKLLKRWRKFYKQMKRYRANPSKKLREEIRDEFRRITSLKTLIRPLDEQLKRTWKNREKLLLFLRYPQVPLHNNQAELDVRERVLKRKISLHNWSKEGIEAWDLMLSLSSTCQKIEISFWEYLRDRVYKSGEIYSLGRVINSLK